MNKIEIFNETNEEIKELEIVEKVLYSAMEKENLIDTSFNLIIVDNDYIHKLNKEYRNIDRETDVITFALEDEDTLIVGDKKRVLGDIYISIDKVKVQASEYGHSEKREICFLVVHGILHLLGYDHMNTSDEKVMFSKQDKILDELDIRRDYA
jgi:probable rRNA maturation factor